MSGELAFAGVLLAGMLMMIISVDADVDFRGVPVRRAIAIPNMVFTMGALELLRWDMGLGEFHLFLGTVALVISFYYFIRLA